jgi:hypothetical protein
MNPIFFTSAVPIFSASSGGYSFFFGFVPRGLGDQPTKKASLSTG